VDAAFQQGKDAHGSPSETRPAIDRQPESRDHIRSADHVGSTASSLCRPAMLQAQRHKIGNIRLTRAHHRVSTTPIDLHRSVRLRNCAASEHHVVNISRNFPRILRLQNPRFAHTLTISFPIRDAARSNRLSSRRCFAQRPTFATPNGAKRAALAGQVGTRTTLAFRRILYKTFFTMPISNPSHVYSIHGMVVEPRPR